MGVGKNLKKHREARGLTLEKLEELSGVAVGTISALEVRDSSRSMYFPALAKAMGMSIEQLFEPPVEDGAAEAQRPQGPPVVGSAKLGDDGHFHELEYPVGHGDGRVDWPSRDPNAYALRCKGESMKPRIRPGEYVVVEPNHEVVSGDEVLVKAKDGRVMVKELTYVRDGMVHLDSVNESHPKISIPLEEIEVMHYVAGIAKAALWQASDSQAAPSKLTLAHAAPVDRPGPATSRAMQIGGATAAPQGKRKRG